MTIQAYCDYYARQKTRPDTDTVEWPQIVVSERQMTEYEVRNVMESWNKIYSARAVR